MNAASGKHRTHDVEDHLDRIAEEFIPFSANAAGVVLTTFGLALMVRDGLLALVTPGLIATGVGVPVVQLVA